MLDNITIHLQTRMTISYSAAVTAGFLLWFMLERHELSARHGIILTNTQQGNDSRPFLHDSCRGVVRAHKSPDPAEVGTPEVSKYGSGPGADQSPSAFRLTPR